MFKHWKRWRILVRLSKDILKSVSDNKNLSTEELADKTVHVRIGAFTDKLAAKKWWFLETSPEEKRMKSIEYKALIQWCIKDDYIKLQEGHKLNPNDASKLDPKILNSNFIAITGSGYAYTSVGNYLADFLERYKVVWAFVGALFFIMLPFLKLFWLELLNFKESLL